jgi:threonine dehydrogenase-like Zn-dependent dehydrogenase
VVFEGIAAAAPYGIVCLTGVSSAGKVILLDGGALNRELVLDNNVVVGSVNANLRHYDLAATALAQANLDWLSRLISRRVPLGRASEAFEPRSDDVKVVITLDGG